VEGCFVGRGRGGVVGREKWSHRVLWPPSRICATLRASQAVSFVPFPKAKSLKIITIWQPARCYITERLLLQCIARAYSTSGPISDCRLIINRVLSVN